MDNVAVLFNSGQHCARGHANGSLAGILDHGGCIYHFFYVAIAMIGGDMDTTLRLILLVVHVFNISLH